MSASGRVALVTGAAAGMGQAFAERLARDGADVVIADVAPAPQTAELVERAGRRALAVSCDVASPEQVAELRSRALEAFGAVDIVVNNAGIYPPAAIEALTFEAWRRVFAVNVDGTFLVTQAFLDGMRSRGWGRVICLASGAFHVGARGFAHYVASKGAVIGFVRALAGEVGEDGVTVNAIAPSVVRTQGTLAGPQASLFEIVARQQAIKRTQEPADVVGTLSFLASEDAAFMTGQTLLIDGGLARA